MAGGDAIFRGDDASAFDHQLAGLIEMRIAYLSDLHLEFEPTNAAGLTPALQESLKPAQGADLLVLAGDIAQGTAGIALADAMSDHVGAPVVYVTGNHEGYGQDLPMLQKRLHDAAWDTDGRVVFLDGTATRFWFSGRPIAVLGCTLWTDYALGGDVRAAMADAARRMNDHKSIGWNGGVFSPEQARAEHQRQRQWLEGQMAALAKEKPRPLVLIVTHHAPCPQAVGARAATLAPSYASDLRDLIAGWGPLIWVHGHTHHRHETTLGQARILSAPRGYASEPYATGFACGVEQV